MHTVSLNLVKPSPNPVRKTWDEEKMEELAASIKERGVIVPIKVRPALFWCDDCGEPFNVAGLRHCPGCAHHYPDDECSNCYRDNSAVATMRAMGSTVELGGGAATLHPYEIVYGHRRAEAARRAGLVEIPAIVEGLDDEDAYTQQLAENESREDVPLEEKARGYRYGMNRFGWSMLETARRAGTAEHDVRRAVLWLGELEQGAAVRRSSNKSEGWTGIEHTIQITRALGDNVEAKRKVAAVVSENDLTATETRAVADAYKAADTPELKDAVLKTSGKLGDADAILRTAKIRIGADPISRYQEEDKRQAFEDYDQAVKDFLDAMKLFDRMLKTAKQAARYGKFSPEGASFAARRIDALIDELYALKGELSHE